MPKLDLNPTARRPRAQTEPLVDRTTTNPMFDERIKKFQGRFIACWAGYPVVGTPEQVVEDPGRLDAAGMDGMITGFLDYHEEMAYFGQRVVPLMKQAGLRHD